MSNVWILGSFCVCLCSCLGKVRVCVRGEFIRGDMSISRGVQKAEPKVIGQAGGIRQLSLAIKTYCVPMLVCVFVCVRACMRARHWEGLVVGQKPLSRDWEQTYSSLCVVCDTFSCNMPEGTKLKQPPLKDKVLFYFCFSVI